MGTEAVVKEPTAGRASVRLVKSESAVQGPALSYAEWAEQTVSMAESTTEYHSSAYQSQEEHSVFQERMAASAAAAIEDFGTNAPAVCDIGQHFAATAGWVDTVLADTELDWFGRLAASELLVCCT